MDEGKCTRVGVCVTVCNASDKMEICGPRGWYQSG